MTQPLHPDTLALFLDTTEAAAAIDYVTRLLRVQTTASILLLTAMLAMRWIGRANLGLGRRRHLITAAIALFAASTVANFVLMQVIFHDGDHTPLIGFSVLASLASAVLAFFGRGPGRAVAIGAGLLIALTWAPFLYAFALGGAQTIGPAAR